MRTEPYAHMYVQYPAPTGKLFIPKAPRPSGATVQASAEFKAEYMGELFPTQWLFEREEGQYPAIFPSAALRSRKAAMVAAAKL